MLKFNTAKNCRYILSTTRRDVYIVNFLLIFDANVYVTET